jgi:hypothetical protein
MTIATREMFGVATSDLELKPSLGKANKAENLRH